MTPRKERLTRVADFTDYQVTLVKDTVLEFPELWMEVFVEGDSIEQRAFAEMFVRARCQKATDPARADLVVFTGGSDVNPVLYGEVAHKSTSFDTARDERDMKLYELCLEEGIPMFGVCRGAQFLHVMNGGKLYQDLDGHYGDHAIFDLKMKMMIQNVSSTHHQACIPNTEGGMEILADQFLSKERWRNDKDKSTLNVADVEAFFYRDTCCLGVQGHPEYRGYHQYLQWTLKQIDTYISCNPDIEVRDNNRRLKREFLAERDARIVEVVKEFN